jgi:hypothetical protein
VAARKAAEATPNGRITLPSGAWYEMGPMTGRDILMVIGLQGHPLTSDDISDLLRLIERRVTASSEADPLDRPIPELLDLLGQWTKRRESAALPPAIASS